MVDCVFLWIENCGCLGKPENRYGSEKIKECSFFRKTRKTITPKPFLAKGDEGLRCFGCKTGKNRCGNVIGPSPQGLRRVGLTVMIYRMMILRLPARVVKT